VNMEHANPSRTALASALKELHEKSGAPSFRKMAQDMNSAYSHTTVAQAFGVKSLPSWEVFREIVRSLNGNERDIHRLWIASYDSAKHSRLKDGPLQDARSNRDADFRPELRTALFVDFDNTYAGLQMLNQDAAEAFANRPQNWLSWLEEGMDLPNHSRRLLVRNVYFSSSLRQPQQQFAAVYARSGFRIIDGTSATGRKVRSADIHMTLDIMDVLNDSESIDEFVIASGDADFVPVIHRLRSRDKRTTILATGPSGTLYRNAVDSFVWPEIFAEAAFSGVDADAVVLTDDYSPELLMTPSASARAVAVSPSGERTSEDLDAVRTAIRTAVSAADRPLVSAAAAHAALRVDPSLKKTDWWGAGSFRAFLALYLEDLEYVGTPSPGYILDPTKHSREDIPPETGTGLDAFLERVCTFTGAPRLNSGQYAVLFQALADDLAEFPFHVNETSKRVRDRTAISGSSVSRSATSFVIQGLIYSGQSLNPATGVREIATGWLKNLRNLYAEGGMTLSPSELDKLHDWVFGALAEEVG
jgi:uncharacterized LabA/DUF88 family protein